MSSGASAKIVIMKVNDDETEIVTGPPRLPREGWEKAFRLMAERGDDRLIAEPRPTLFDETEWEY